MPASPELTGGAGFTFEDAVSAWYLTALLAERPATGLPAGFVERIDLQRGALGEPLDDIIVTGSAAHGGAVLGLQVKRAFAVNARASNTDFRDTVARGWRTLVDPAKAGRPVVIGVVAGEINDDQLRAMQTLGEWARLSADAADFLGRVAVAGLASDRKRKAVAAVRTALDAALGRGAADDEVHRFFKAFVLIRLSLLGASASDVQPALDRLSGALRTPSPEAEAELWGELRIVAREAAGAAGSFTRPSLIERLGRSDRFAVAPSWRDDVARLAAESTRALTSIEQSIDGLVIRREGLLARVTAGLATERIVQITGQPGVGKSVLLRAFAAGRAPESPLVVLKADQLAEGGWAGYAQRLGLNAPDLRPVLRELAATGDPVLLIDGLDRIRKAHRPLLLAILDAVLDDADLARWRIVASLRDGGWEFAGRWAPVLRRTPYARVDVGNLDDAEAALVASAHPRLRDLLFGDDAVREIARRPFFLNVLASAVDLELEKPSSETELLAAWWNGGGYDAEGAARAARQRALVELGRSTAGTLGREGPSLALDPEAVESLKADHILRDAEPGHTVSFRHDIFFEWAFVHLLIEAGPAWADRLVEAGEPPALGRPVELYSQRRFERDLEWRQELDRLEASGRRTQWRRSWLLGPPSSPKFGDLHDRYFDAVFIDDDGARLKALLVWFQAVRTEPAENLLGLPGVADLSEAQRLQLADRMARPTDVAAWRRMLAWLIGAGARLPPAAWPRALTLMDVWQTATGPHPNPLSAGLLALAETWLHRLEDHRHPRDDVDERFDRFPGLSYEEEKDLRDGLRELLVRASVQYPDIGRRYLDRLLDRPQLGREAWDAVLPLAPYLAVAAPARLADAFAAEVCTILPQAKREREIEDEARRRRDAESFPQGSRRRALLMPSGLGGQISSWDWDQLSLARDSRHFSPPSARREPFAALFQHAPRDALRLVKALGTHAVAAWRELNALDPSRGGAPLPLTLDFPWGPETFWGAEREYFGYRGAFAPPVLASGLMALEAWAFGRLDAGEPLDAVIEDVVWGVPHNAVLGIASALALETLRATPAVLPLVSSPRLWRWDLQRLVRIDSGQPSNEIGAFNPRDLHALRRGNARPARQRWLRQLAPVFVLSPDEALRTAFSAALAAFPTNPPLDYEAERDDAETIAQWVRDARRWATLGEASGYEFEAADGGTIIREKPPEFTEEAERASVAEHGETMRWIALANAARALRAEPQNPLPPEIVSEARALDDASLFSTPAFAGDLSVLRQSGVAGVAAALLLSDQAGPDDLAWAADAILRAADTPLANDGLTYEDTVFGDHPLLQVPGGLAAMLRREVEPFAAAERLLGLSTHFVREFGVAAFVALMGLADADAEFARAALQFNIDLSVRSDTIRLRRQDPARADAARERDIAAAWNRAVDVIEGRAEIVLPDLPLPPPEADAEADDEFHALWNEPTWFDTHWLGPLLPALASARTSAALAPLIDDIADRLFAWTVARATPVVDRIDRADFRSSEWRTDLLGWLAVLAADLDTASLTDRFVDPILALPDPLFLAFAEPFVGQFAATRIHDAPELTPDTVAILLRFAERATALRLGRRADEHLERLIADLMGVPMIRAGLARRFANGDWSDLPRMLPVIEVLFDAFSTESAFLRIWLNLVDDAAGSYPRARLAEQLDRAIGGMRPGDLAPDLSSRIAGLVQTHAELADELTATDRHHFLRVLDVLIDSGSRRAAALQRSEAFRGHARSS